MKASGARSTSKACRGRSGARARGSSCAIACCPTPERTGARSAFPMKNCRPASNPFPFTIICSRKEHIIALEGEATLRLGEERYRIKAGDYVGFPAGQRAGHCLINESDRPFRFIMVGDREPNEAHLASSSTWRSPPGSSASWSSWRRACSSTCFSSRTCSGRVSPTASSAIRGGGYRQLHGVPGRDRRGSDRKCPAHSMSHRTGGSSPKRVCARRCSPMRLDEANIDGHANFLVQKHFSVLEVADGTNGNIGFAKYNHRRSAGLYFPV